jgi:hypothetical protein
MTGFSIARTSPLIATEAAATPVVYADSRQALILAWEGGLSRDLPIRSNAPALIADPEVRACRADERLTPGHIRALVSVLIAAATEVHDAILKSVLPGSREAAMAIFSSLTSEFQNHVFTAAMLRDADLNNGSCVVTARHGTEDLRRRFRFTLADVLANAGGAAPREIDGGRLSAIDEPAPPHPNIVTRLASATAESIAYRIGRAVWASLPGSGPRGTVAIYRENELLKETATHLMARGYAIRGLALREGGESEATKATLPSVTAAIQRHLEMVLPSRVAAALGRIADNLTATRLSDFSTARAAWRAQLNEPGARPCVVLSNRLHTAEYWALLSALTEARIPLAAFQHGVTPEFALDRVDEGYGLESAGADIAFVFNPEQVAMSAASPHSRGPAVDVGMPKDYRKLRRRITGGSAPPVWYIRTALYQSNLGRMHRGLSDPTMYERERLLVEQVFARLPHRIAYKPYPAIRYLDRDPVEALIDSTPNTTVYEGRLDLRYVVAQARLLVTAGATSTLSWCLMADRPLVFLDDPDFLTLRHDARARLEEAAFVFDMGEAGAIDRLRDFLSRPLEVIEIDWQRKASARRTFIRHFVDSGEGRAGAAAARAIENLLHNRAAVERA